jgi:hypothetical protein
MNGSSLIIKLKRSSSPLGACSCSTIEDKNLIKGKKKKKEKKKPAPHSEAPSSA